MEAADKVVLIWGFLDSMKAVEDQPFSYLLSIWDSELEKY